MSDKGQYKVKSKIRLPILVVLAMLTLFSSCSVRKSIQTQLDIPVTSQLSPSKAILTGEQHCEYSDNVTLLDQANKTGFKLPVGFLPSSSNLYLPAPERIKEQAICVSEVGFVSDKVPIYILYKKMKLWA
jgi:hypothetical protein